MAKGQGAWPLLLSEFDGFSEKSLFCRKILKLERWVILKLLIT